MSSSSRVLHVKFLHDPRNSLAFWYPRVKNVVPTPETHLVPVNRSELAAWTGGERSLPDGVEDWLKMTAARLGYPVFMRTDLTSGKFHWQESCYVADETRLIRNLFNLVEQNEMAGPVGLPFSHIVLRQYVPLESTFTAYRNKMPVTKEQRWFLRDGRVECRHPYWPESAFARVADPHELLGRTLPGAVSHTDWRQRLRDLQQISDDDLSILNGYMSRLGRVLEGYWSTDFAKAKDGRWLLLDMALGDVSDHWKDCLHASKGELVDSVEED